MITIDDKVYRNMQEQIAKNKEDIERLSSGVKIEYDVDTVAQLSQFITEAYVGKYIYCNEDSHLYLITKRQLTSGYDANDLGLYPAVVKGAKGDTGATGENGSNGKGIVGIGSSVPNNDIGTDGDYYIVKLALHDYLYKKVGGVWVNQLDFKGSKGNDGCNVPVYANTGEAYSYTLTDIKVDGVVYMIPSLDDTSFTGTTTAENIIVSGDTVLNGANITGDMLPSISNTYSIGNSTHYFSYGYIYRLTSYVADCYQVQAEKFYENNVLLSNKYQPKEKAMTLIETITLDSNVSTISRTYGTNYKKLFITLESTSNLGVSPYIKINNTIVDDVYIANSCKIATIDVECKNDTLFIAMNGYANIYGSSYLSATKKIYQISNITSFILMSNGAYFATGTIVKIYGVAK